MGENEIRRRIRLAIERFGVRGTSRRARLSSESVLRLGGGFRVHPGTLLVARTNIERLDDPEADTGEPSAA